MVRFILDNKIDDITAPSANPTLDTSYPVDNLSKSARGLVSRTTDEIITGTADANGDTTTLIDAAVDFSNVKSGDLITNTTKDITVEVISAGHRNLLVYSEQFDSWTNRGTPTIIANAITAPDGTLTADLIEDSDPGFNEGKTQTATVADDSATYTASIYLKEGTATSNEIGLKFEGGAPTVNSSALVSWSNGIPSVTAVASATTVTVEYIANGWYRVSVTCANNSSGNETIRMEVWPIDWVSGGATTGNVYAWGAQLTLGRYIQPYFKTEANNADEHIITTEDISPETWALDDAYSINMGPPDTQEYIGNWGALSPINSFVIGRHNFSKNVSYRLELFNGSYPAYDSGKIRVEGQDVASDYVPWGTFPWGLSPWGINIEDRDNLPRRNLVHWPAPILYNSISYSDDLDTTVWNPFNVNIITDTNVPTSDGKNNMHLIESNSTGICRLNQSLGVPTGNIEILKCHVKYYNATHAYIGLFNFIENDWYCLIDIEFNTDGTLNNISTESGAAIELSSTPLDNGIYEILIRTNTTFSGVYAIRIFPDDYLVGNFKGTYFSHMQLIREDKNVEYERTKNYTAWTGSNIVGINGYSVDNYKLTIYNRSGFQDIYCNNEEYYCNNEDLYTSSLLVNSEYNLPYIEIGRLFLGKYTEPAYNISFNHQLSHVENTKQYRARSGTLLSDVRSKNKKFTFDLNTIPEADRITLHRDIAEVGLTKDFFVSIFPEDSNENKQIDYSGIVKLTKIPRYKEFACNYYKSKFIMEEA